MPLYYNRIYAVRARKPHYTYSLRYNNKFTSRIHVYCIHIILQYFPYVFTAEYTYIVYLYYCTQKTVDLNTFFEFSEKTKDGVVSLSLICTLNHTHSRTVAVILCGEWLSSCSYFVRGLCGKDIFTLDDNPRRWPSQTSFVWPVHTRTHIKNTRLNICKNWKKLLSVSTVETSYKDVEGPIFSSIKWNIIVT